MPDLLLPGLYRVYLSIDADCEGVSSANVFLLPDEAGRSLMIDTGFRDRRCLETLERAFRELSIDPERLDVVLTHRHHDHSGLAGELAARGARIYMNSEEERHAYDCLTYRPRENSREEQEKILEQVGVTKALAPAAFEAFLHVNRSYAARDEWFLSLPDFPYEDIRDGAVFERAGHCFHTLPLRGHTYGQTGLYDPDCRWIFSADQLIPGVSPIVATTYFGEGLLSAFFDSLDELAEDFSDYLFIPSHGEPFRDPAAVREETRSAYRRRILKVREVVTAAELPLTVRETALKAYHVEEVFRTPRDFMKYKMILTKTYSILEYLAERGEISCFEKERVYYFA